MNRPRHTNTAARPGVVPDPANNASANVDGALSRLSLTVQTALVRAERNRAAGRGGRS